MKAISLLIALAWPLAAQCAPEFDTKQIERGRYLVRTTGCNDCHTPRYAQRGGNVAEKDWLIGDAMGWHGPWGTTFPTNLRKTVRAMTEQQWLEYAGSVKTRPPMPWFSLHAMEQDDLRAIYRFVYSLGDSGHAVPAALPPGRKPATPYVDLHPVMPGAAQRQ
ncbi:hypothetical protein [Acidovorax sp. MR-S7]|uniref:hypothetical protein n=1 Tax=Acidovorax sp. MR-S7 TaxID=1268622 RepID=UPI00035EE03C|nr:hypothetical protein [Acidovorax sp. MR-S7]GAD20659.1 cytochrome c, mono- and diheme variants [Acidovorax sp. MR-S7]